MTSTPIQPQTVPTWLRIVRLLRWDKPEGRLILMIPALWAVFLAAQGLPDPRLVAVIVLGSITTSAAGCVVNDLWDRDIDPKVKRTRTRPLADRSFSVKTGVGVALVAFACAAGLAVYLNPWQNPLSFWLCVAAVPVIVLYPLAKRVFPVPQLVLSIAWGFAVLISWSAVSGQLAPATGWLWAATVLWTLGFDTVYAMADREDDRHIGINSSALFFGEAVHHAVGIFFVGSAIALAGLGWTMQLSAVFWVTLAIATGGWIWQYRQLGQSDLPNPTYGQIFRQNVWLGFILLAGMIGGALIA